MRCAAREDVEATGEGAEPAREGAGPGGSFCGDFARTTAAARAAACLSGPATCLPGPAVELPGPRACLSTPPACRSWGGAAKGAGSTGFRAGGFHPPRRIGSPPSPGSFELTAPLPHSSQGAPPATAQAQPPARSGSAAGTPHPRSSHARSPPRSSGSTARSRPRPRGTASSRAACSRTRPSVIGTPAACSAVLMLEASCRLCVANGASALDQGASPAPNCPSGSDDTYRCTPEPLAVACSTRHAPARAWLASAARKSNDGSVSFSRVVTTAMPRAVSAERRRTESESTRFFSSSCGASVVPVSMPPWAASSSTLNGCAPAPASTATAAGINPAQQSTSTNKRTKNIPGPQPHMPIPSRRWLPPGMAISDPRMVRPAHHQAHTWQAHSAASGKSPWTSAASPRRQTCSRAAAPG